MAVENVGGMLAPQNTEPTATYNYQDLAAGTGFITYYAGIANSNLLLSTIKYSADSVFTEYVNNTSEDFAVTIQKSITLAGTTIVNVPAYGYNAPVGNLTVTIKKNSTTLVSASSAALVNNTYRAYPIVLTIPTTQFAKGDVLHMVVSYSGTNNVRVAHEPNNRSEAVTWDATTLSSTFLIQIPMRIYS